jgi:hypothetical protein
MPCKGAGHGEDTSGEAPMQCNAGIPALVTTIAVRCESAETACGWVVLL